MKQFILDLLFPKRCIRCNKLGSYICADCFATISFVTNFVCPVCNKSAVNGMTHPVCVRTYGIDGVVSSVSYKGVVKRLVYQFKYKPYISDLEEVMSELLYEGIIQNELLYHVAQYIPIVTCVPLHKSKLRSRGYNHAALLAKNLAQKMGLEFIDNLLIRTRSTKPQYNLDKEIRIKNIKGAFGINEDLKQKIKGKYLLIVDDLATSFTTLSECAKVLKRNGAYKVYGATFAREQ